MMEERKVVVVGAGQVGSTFAYALANEHVADDIAILDVDEQFARGQVLDLAHGQPFMPPVNIHQGSPEDYADAHIKGATSFAVGLALVRICGAILRNEHSVLTVSVLLDGEYGIEDVCLSVPCLVSRRGIERIISGSLTEPEREGLAASAKVLNKAWSDLHSESQSSPA